MDAQASVAVAAAPTLAQNPGGPEPPINPERKPYQWERWRQWQLQAAPTAGAGNDPAASTGQQQHDAAAQQAVAAPPGDAAGGPCGGADGPAPAPAVPACDDVKQACAGPDAAAPLVAASLPAAPGGTSAAGGHPQMQCVVVSMPLPPGAAVAAAAAAAAAAPCVSLPPTPTPTQLKKAWSEVVRALDSQPQHQHQPGHHQHAPVLLESQGTDTSLFFEVGHGPISSSSSSCGSFPDVGDASHASSHSGDAHTADTPGVRSPLGPSAATLPSPPLRRTSIAGSAPRPPDAEAPGARQPPPPPPPLQRQYLRGPSPDQHHSGSPSPCYYVPVPVYVPYYPGSPPYGPPPPPGAAGYPPYGPPPSPGYAWATVFPPTPGGMPPPPIGHSCSCMRAAAAAAAEAAAMWRSSSMSVGLPSSPAGRCGSSLGSSSQLNADAPEFRSALSARHRLCSSDCVGSLGNLLRRGGSSISCGGGAAARCVVVAPAVRPEGSEAELGWAWLAEVVLQRVFLEVPSTREGRSSARLACRRWREASDRSTRALAPLRLRRELASVFTALRGLDLTHCVSVRNRDLAMMAEGLPQLEEVTIRDDPRKPWVTNKGVGSVGKMTGLRSLALHDCNSITNNGLVQLSGLLALTRLSMRGCKKVTNNGLEFLKPNKVLHTLNLFNCARMSDNGILILSHLPLRALSLGLTRVRDKGLAYLSRQTQLIELHFTGEEITDAGLAHLSALTGLSALSLRGCNFVTGDAIEALLPSLPNLDSLNLFALSTFGDANLGRALAAAPQLRGLDLRGTRVTAPGLLTHAEALAGLLRLAVCSAAAVVTPPPPPPARVSSVAWLAAAEDAASVSEEEEASAASADEEAAAPAADEAAAPAEQAAAVPAVAEAAAPAAEAAAAPAAEEEAAAAAEEVAAAPAAEEEAAPKEAAAVPAVDEAVAAAAPAAERAAAPAVVEAAALPADDSSLVEVLTRLGGLERVAISGPRCSDALVQALSALPNLQELVLTPYIKLPVLHELEPLVPERLALSPAALATVGTLTSLTALDLSRNDLAADRLETLISGLPRVREVALHGGSLTAEEAAAVGAAVHGRGGREPIVGLKRVQRFDTMPELIPLLGTLSAS